MQENNYVLDQLNPGFYFVRLSSGDASAIKKLIVK